MRAEEEAEFRRYVAARSDRLRRFGYLCCGDWQRAEDAVQTSLIKLYAAWTRISHNACDAYVRRIVANTLISEHRRGWFRRERVSERPPERQIPDQSEATADTLAVMSALARLPPRQRAVVVLRYWEDLPIEQVAEIMRCSTGTVKSQGTRGLRTLRALLSAAMPERTMGASS
ncbi:SigE family RNA polymerase sigma factor [Phytomonospora endophytica]|uniref:RNA polymerase sigma-70 factor (Sigma-E family) n=1 Tax=Phytomonospora endophytica TaxID=714109 RepID=A0A841F8A5_9ACTN|nr:SigE family RNA polymerase sigma factor [Phytomonospora endophytica]MBB6033301.1 RNA polymerase sigma-70 factor (sigma-E family) [Phytomonospora endophytica]GIG65528.1 DNA-directed RNA polymerase sigma-70 factor [Phytomonospora endophytica]